MEAHYAADFPFVDYGVDIPMMAELEKGVKVMKIKRSETDIAKAGKPETNETEEYLALMKKKRYTKIPIGYAGRGPRGYLLYDMVYHRTRSAAQARQSFKDLVRYSGTKQENLTKRRLIDRMRIAGPRFATLNERS